jgi:hypothetical protein
VITLTIDRSSLGLLPLTINDSGTGTYVLTSFMPGAKSRDNSYAQSRWLDGGRLVSTRTEIVTMDMVVRINSTTVPLLLDAATVLETALDQFGYTITEAVSGAVSTTTYTCMPASTSFPYDPVQFRRFTGLFTASIPRQP